MAESLHEKSLAAVQYTRDVGIGYLNTSTDYFDGQKIESEKGKFTIFGLCDYLKIMPDDRIKAGAIEAIQNHGINFAVSRAYLKLHLYKEAEEALATIFHKPIVLFARTALAHIGTLPALVEHGDAVILDQQVHSTLQSGAEILQSRGIHVEIIRHNRMDMLEGRINKLKDTYHKIWYLADGIYSMYGDMLPTQEITALLDKYEQLRLYVDDAHGMSWYGENGSGFVLAKMGYHPQMILTASLGKGYGAGGGIIVCPDDKTKDRVIFTGGPLMFSSPIEPSMQGAIIASSKIHLSDEIYEKQNAINDLMEHFYLGVKKRELPLVNADKTPIGYFPTGKNEELFYLIEYLQNNGMITTAGIHPAVSINNTGVRVQIALYQNKMDIDLLLDLLQEGYRKIEQERGVSIAKILKHFKH